MLAFLLSRSCIVSVAFSVGNTPEFYSTTVFPNQEMTISSAIKNTIYVIYTYQNSEAFTFEHDGITEKFSKFLEDNTVLFAKKAGSKLTFRATSQKTMRVAAVGLDNKCPQTFVTNSGPDSQDDPIRSCYGVGECCYFFASWEVDKIEFLIKDVKENAQLKYDYTNSAGNDVSLSLSSTKQDITKTITIGNTTGPVLMHLILDYSTPYTYLAKFKYSSSTGTSIGGGPTIRKVFNKMYPTPPPEPEPVTPTPKKKKEIPLPAIIAPCSIIGMIIIIIIGCLCFRWKIKRRQIQANKVSSSSDSSVKSNHDKPVPLLYNDDGTIKSGDTPNTPYVPPNQTNMYQPYQPNYSENPYDGIQDNAPIYPPPPI